MNQIQKELALFREAVEKLDQGLVVLTRAGRVALITTRAQKWLAKYLGKRCQPEDRLPRSLQQWIREQEAASLGKHGDAPPRKVLAVERGGKRLEVKLVSGPNERLLVLDEQLISPPPSSLDRFGLTRKEREVLALVSQGKTNAEIGKILSISPRTVGKHLEHIYQKVGVETRTSAAFSRCPPTCPAFPVRPVGQ